MDQIAIKEQESCKGQEARGMQEDRSRRSVTCSALAPWPAQNGLNGRPAPSKQSGFAEQVKSARHEGDGQEETRRQKTRNKTCKLEDEALLTFSIFACRKDRPASRLEVREKSEANMIKIEKTDSALVTSLAFACKENSQASRQEAGEKQEARDKSPEALLTFLDCACREESRAIWHD
jgi:hypothetical protein